MLKRLFCCLLLMACVGSTGFAQQTPTTQGTRFWVSFMRNGYRNNGTNDNLTLFASAKRSCQVTVSNPNTQWSEEFNVHGNSVASFSIPDAQGYCDQEDGLNDPSKINKGLYVVAEDTVSLYIANETQNSYDAANVLPVEALGCKYMVQTNKSLYYTNGSHAEDNRASFLIIATEDNTQVQITPSCETMDNHSQGEAYSITLQAGQCYHVLNKNPGYASNVEGDFSGTVIESLNNKPIAVFNGNSITSVADGSVNEGYDHVFEQAMPVDNWGKHFVVTKTKGPHNLQNDRVKVTALYDQTEVLRDGVSLCPPLAAGQSYDFWMTQNCCYLESSGPVAVYLYNHSHSSSNTYGDPSMVWISPVEQNLQEVIFSTFSSAANLTHYVNVVCYTEDLEHLKLNGSPIAQTYIEGQVPGAPQFSYARVLLSTPGKNSLSCPNGLVAHVYGMGVRQGYAYTVGSSAKTLTTQLYINGELYDNYIDGYTTCQNKELQFSVEANFNIDHVVWNFTDGYSTTGETVSHAFEYEGIIQVEAFVYRNAEEYEVLFAEIHVSPIIEQWVSETTCDPTYSFHGNSYPVPYFDDVVVSSEEGCDTIYHLDITEGSSESFVLYDTACNSYLWFDTLRYESNTYVVVKDMVGGCDSLFILHLTIGKPPENPIRYHSSCYPYLWDNRIVCDTSGIYRLPFTSETYCEYDSVLYFTRDYEPPFERIMGLSQVAVATTFWPGKYNYYLDDSTGMNISRIQWELMGNPEGPGHWEFEPHGASCTITAYSMGERVLWVNSGDGPCGKEAFKTINCTAYSVEEDEMSSLEIYPNPAKDEITVKGPELLELNLYNLLGQRLKSVSANVVTEMKLEVGGLPQALYLLEIRTSRGNKTRLVSVIK